MKITYYKPYPIRSWLLALICFSLFLAINGCFSSYGRIRSNENTDMAFKSYEIPANYKFYYYGRSNMPYAIIGLDSQYTLISRLWREVDPASMDFREMVAWTWWDRFYYPNYPRGKDILDPGGKKIGIWYSSARWAAVKMLDDRGSVMIAPDTPWELGGH